MPAEIKGVTIFWGSVWASSLNIKNQIDFLSHCKDDMTIILVTCMYMLPKPSTRGPTTVFWGGQFQVWINEESFVRQGIRRKKCAKANMQITKSFGYMQWKDP